MNRLLKAAGHKVVKALNFILNIKENKNDSNRK